MGKHTNVLEFIISYLRAYNIFLFKRQVGCFKVKNRFIRIGKKGQADLYGFIVSHVKQTAKPIEIEVKTGKDKLTKDQKRWKEFCENNYITYICVYEKTLQNDLTSLVSELGFKQ